jgi:hypothetical protein
MTRLRSLPTALAAFAVLSAGAVGATTLVSTHGTNTLRISQSSSGTLIHDGIGAHYVAPATVSREPLVLHHPVRDEVETENPGAFARLFMFLNPFDGFHRDRPSSRATEDCFPEVPTRNRATAMFDDMPSDNRAVGMMRSMLGGLGR